MSLQKTLKIFNLKTSFKNMVKLDNSGQLARASTTTTTPSTTTTSAVSKLLQALLRLFDAYSHGLCNFCLLHFACLLFCFSRLYFSLPTVPPVDPMSREGAKATVRNYK